jgi:hypothetical protein
VVNTFTVTTAEPLSAAPTRTEPAPADPPTWTRPSTAAVTALVRVQRGGDFGAAIGVAPADGRAVYTDQPSQACDPSITAPGAAAAT